MPRSIQAIVVPPTLIYHLSVCGVSQTEHIGKHGVLFLLVMFVDYKPIAQTTQKIITLLMAIA